MSDILLKSMHFPSLDARYIVGDDDLSTAGAAADAKATGDALETKADKTDTYTKAQVDTKVGDAKTELEEAIDDLDERKAEIDGYYETFTSGQTNQLIATEAITDTEPYNFRKTGGPNDVGNRVYDTLVGGSVVWNQLVASGTTEVTVPNGHKYYANINGTKSIGASTGTAISINDSAEDNIIDLTAALGSTIADYVYSLETATAGAGVAWFRKYFPKEYHAYCEPHFEHVQTSAKETVGFNLLNPANTIKGGYNVAVGSVLSSGQATATLTGDNPVNVSITSGWQAVSFVSDKLLPNTVYYINCVTDATTPSKVRLTAYLVDESYNVVRNYGPYTTTHTYHSTVTTTDKDGLRFVLYVSSESANTITCTDLCLNLHGDRDGEYEAYRKRTYPIEPKVLRGVPKLDSANRLYFDGDIYGHDGSGESRYAEYTFTGNETWSFFDADGKNTFNCVISGAKSGGNGLMAGKYAWSSVSVISLQDDKTFIFFTGTGGTRISVYDSAYSDVDAFKASMAGVKLLYEKATPEPFTAEPFQSPMVVDPLGTEEFVDYGVTEGDRDVAIPVGHNSEYPADLRGKLQRLPSPTGTNGDYIVTEVDGKLYLKPYVPAVGLTAPTTEGEGE